MWKLLAGVTVAAALVAGCGSGSGNKSGAPAGTTAHAGTVEPLDPPAYKAAIVGPRAFVVNVHTPYEREIEGTDEFIPYDKIAEHASELPADKAAPLYIYCRSGRMSALAVPALQRLGYINIIDLKGGMQAWVDAGLPLVDRKPG
jgi:rhodanese-related sulfurtransferase